MAAGTPRSVSAWPQARSALRQQRMHTVTVMAMGRDTATTAVDRMDTMTMARATITGTIATTTVGKDRYANGLVKKSPEQSGLFLCL